jgi:cystathionine beta-lyase/cystathionine gamma-synthase
LTPWESSWRNLDEPPDARQFTASPCQEDQMSERKKSPARGVRTRAVHGAHPEKPGPSSTPIVHSATFSFPNLEAMKAERDKHAAGAYYQRDGHPTLRATEERLAALEGAESGILFASGVAAIAAVLMASLKSGDHVVALHQCYGGTHDLLRWGAERFGWSFDLVDAREEARWAAAFRPNTRLFHVETPTNPMLCILDLRRAAELAHARGARLTVDNTFASPVGQHPLELGADLVIYSATKSIGGHGDLLAGAVLGPAAGLEVVWKVRKVFGAVPDPSLAWQIERSLKTLPLRVEAANANALELASRLTRHPGVAQVFYPGLPGHPGHDVAARQMSLGFGPVVAIDVHGGAAGSEAVVNALQLFRHAPSLGGVDSLASLPAHTSHVQLGPEGRARAGIPEGLVRLSVGVEDVDDLWSDLDQALARTAVTASTSGRS